MSSKIQVTCAENQRSIEIAGSDVDHVIEALENLEFYYSARVNEAEEFGMGSIADLKRELKDVEDLIDQFEKLKGSE